MAADGSIDRDEVAASLPRDLALLVLVSALPAPQETLRQASGAGDLPLVRTLAAGLPSSCSADDWGAAFVAACGGGHLETAKWLAGQTRPSTRRQLEALAAAGSAGHLATVRWLAAPFVSEGPRVSEGAGAAFRAALTIGALSGACENGHLEVARWLTERFRLDAAGGEGLELHILSKAIRGGHLETARWFAARFRLDWPSIHLAAMSVFGFAPPGASEALRVSTAIAGRSAQPTPTFEPGGRGQA